MKMIESMATIEDFEKLDIRVGKVTEVERRHVLCVVNFPPHQIGTHQSEVLTIGVPDANGNVVLVRPDVDVPLGGRLY